MDYCIVNELNSFLMSESLLLPQLITSNIFVCLSINFHSSNLFRMSRHRNTFFQAIFFIFDRRARQVLFADNTFKFWQNKLSWLIMNPLTRFDPDDCNTCSNFQLYDVVHFRIVCFLLN